MIIRVSAKCSDMCMISGDGIDYDGYVPQRTGIGGADYIDMEIDTNTGQIVDFPKLTDEKVRESIEAESN